MNTSEGISRIAKVISAIGWLIGLMLFVVAVSALPYGDVEDFLGFSLSGAAVWLGLQAVVWIIDGFAGNKGDKSNIIWPSTLLDYWVKWQLNRNNRAK